MIGESTKDSPIVFYIIIELMTDLYYIIIVNKKAVDIW